MSEALFAASDLAAFCQVDGKTIHNWCNKGTLPHFRTPGRHLRFRASEVRWFLDKHGYPIPGELRDVKPVEPALNRSAPRVAATPESGADGAAPICGMCKRPAVWAPAMKKPVHGVTFGWICENDEGCLNFGEIPGEPPPDRAERERIYVDRTSSPMANADTDDSASSPVPCSILNDKQREAVRAWHELDPVLRTAAVGAVADLLDVGSPERSGALGILVAFSPKGGGS